MGGRREQPVYVASTWAGLRWYSLVPGSSELKPSACPCLGRCRLALQRRRPTPPETHSPWLAEATSAGAAPHQRAPPPTAASRRISPPRPTGNRAFPPPPRCPELPTLEPSAVSTEHPCASKPTPRRRPELSAAGTKTVATAGLLSPFLSVRSPLGQAPLVALCAPVLSRSRSRSDRRFLHRVPARWTPPKRALSAFSHGKGRCVHAPAQSIRGCPVRTAGCSASTDVRALPRGRRRRTIRCCPRVSNPAFSLTLRPAIDAVTCPRSFRLAAPISDAFAVGQPSTTASRPTENPHTSGGRGRRTAPLAASPLLCSPCHRHSSFLASANSPSGE